MGNRGRGRSAESDFGELAGEVAAFLRRILRSDERVDASLTCLRRDEHHGMVWYLEPIGLPAMLLYTFDFRLSGAEQTRERFFAQLKRLEGSGKACGDNERLVAFHHGGDCAFALTAKGTDYDVIAGTNSPSDGHGVRRSPLAEATRLLRADQAERALKLCRDLLREFPWHQQAY